MGVLEQFNYLPRRKRKEIRLINFGLKKYFAKKKGNLKCYF